MFFMSKPDVSSANIHVTVITCVTDNLKFVYACMYVCVCMGMYTHTHTHIHTRHYFIVGPSTAGKAVSSVTVQH
jgi:hypothetical protein